MFLRTDARYCAIGPVLYFDEHGEPDRSLKRGNPLFLSAKNVAQLRALLRDFLVDDLCGPNFTTSHTISLI